MRISTQQPPSARAALVYITAGALLMAWTGIWYAYLRNYPPQSQTTYYWCAGFLATGLILFLIGLAVGQIGRSARKADQGVVDVPPPPPAVPAGTGVVV